jgi:hypothetical protein
LAVRLDGALAIAEFLVKECKDRGLVPLALHLGNVFTDIAAVMGQVMANILKETAELMGDSGLGALFSFTF